ncbi:hypothetical protein BT96DRAFT_913868 [Gymnopus androsaceus JB14]|uniref:Protein prenylyltransferase n=1 Tax=Gymnopus androsaceus JB14 TaxID=1447944 RepID=A0A6A4IIA3_9AGAR|nr:hypothetical protein BT96DRAFT_913868 [Gymnopus androsaceus JB14]
MSDDLEIISAITEILNSSPSSVEILPGSVEQWQTDPAAPFLFTDGHLGVPQKLLYRLYPCALDIFRKSRLSNSSSSSPKSLLEASSIILLANPAHQTALHERKRLVLAAHLSVEKELDFTTLLLSSSRDASKQSIIWDHRRWLFQTGTLKMPPILYDQRYQRPCSRKNSVSFYKVPSVYSRNYYAWAHWDWCCETLYTLRTPQNEDEYLPVVAEAFLHLLQWMEHHLSDYTAAFHLCNLVRRFHKLEYIQQLPDVEMTFERLFEQAVSLVARYPDHEALWMYLRAVWTIGGLGDNLNSIASLPACKYREQCISWCNDRI